MSKTSQKMKFILQLLIVVTGGFVLAIACSTTYWFFSALERRSSEREANCATLDAQPIPDRVITSLCDSNLIPASLGACNGEEVRVEDLRTIVKSNVLPNNSTYDDVKKIFGIYEIYCETPPQDSPTFRCRYEIGVTWPRISIFYNSETDIVESIRVTSCGGS